MGDDDMSIGEIARSLRRIENAQKDMVSAKLYETEQKMSQQFLNDHVTRTGQALDRIERQVDEFRKATVAELKSIAEDTGKELAKIREDLSSAPAHWADKAWTRGAAVVAILLTLAGVFVAALNLRKG